MACAKAVANRHVNVSTRTIGANAFAKASQGVLKCVHKRASIPSKELGMKPKRIGPTIMVVLVGLALLAVCFGQW